MALEEVINNLINNACPSISMRTKEEILGLSLDTLEKSQYLSNIVESPVIHEILEWQQSDGYFGARLHTPISRSKIWPHEGCVRYLLEMGLDINFEPLRRALEALLADNWEKECAQSKSKAAQIFGEGMIRASLFARAGYEDYDFVRQWIDISLQAFRHLALADSLAEIAVPYKDKYIFTEDKFIPVIYHLRILAFTKTWRTDSNYEMVSTAVNKLYEWLPFPSIYIKAKSQLVAPAGNIMHQYNEDLFNIDDSYVYSWLSVYELFARMGMLSTESPFRKHFDNLLSFLAENNNYFLKKLKKKSFFNWSGYSGMALEDSWKSSGKRLNDFGFRIALIDRYKDRRYI